MQKKKPQRTCIVCKEEADKKTLVRIVRNAQGVAELDLTGKKSGRGAYVCKDEACISKLKKGKFLNRALKIEISDEIYDNLIKELLALE